MRCMYKSVKKTKFIHKYMEALAFHTGAPTVHWEDKTHCISVVEYKIVTPRVKHIAISVFFYMRYLKIVSLFQNIRSTVSCRHICTSNHVQVQ